MDNSLVSLNELYKAGIDIMLKGIEPQTIEDWERLIHFWAYNISPETLPSSVELLCTVFSSPLKNDRVLEIVSHYKALAVQRQEDALKKIIGKPVTHAHLKHLRSIMSQNIEYDGLIEIFKKASIPPTWPNHDSWELWAKLCNALFLMKHAKFKESQKAMIKVIEGGTK